MNFGFRSQCPIASALDILGDRWTLVVMRMLFAGKSKYGELLAIPESVSTNILANRLALLEEHGLVTRRQYQSNPPRHRYILTRKGADLLPVLQALSVWGASHIADRWKVPEPFLKAEPRHFYPAEDRSSQEAPPSWGDCAQNGDEH
jgi:DNA-binding HxlR family transcriptional regulator